jgi:hypothetical protein
MSMRVKAFSLVVLALLLAVPACILAIPSANFYGEDFEVFDDWDVCRTSAVEVNSFFSISAAAGFQPIIVEESLGENADVAYRMGLRFAAEYPDSNQRAEQIFIFVRDSVRYTSDKSQFGFPEFAQNADELGNTIKVEGVAYGDCEDYAVLLAVIYKAAGLRSAIALTSDHAAALVFLPEYKKASQILSVDGETGWIWAEATGGNNPLGWIPEGYGGKVIEVKELENKALIAGEPPDKEPVTVTSRGGGGGSIPLPSFFTVIFIMWFLSLFRRRRRG